MEERKEVKKMKGILVLVPLKWLEMIDKAKEDMERNEFIRTAIRDALILKGVWYESMNDKK